MKDWKKRRELTSKWVQTTKEEDELGNWEDFIRHDAVEQYKKEQLALFSVSKSVPCGNCSAEESDMYCKECWENACNSYHE